MLINRIDGLRSPEDLELLKNLYIYVLNNLLLYQTQKNILTHSFCVEFNTESICFKKLVIT